MHFHVLPPLPYSAGERYGFPQNADAVHVLVPINERLVHGILPFCCPATGGRACVLPFFAVAWVSVAVLELHCTYIPCRRERSIPMENQKELYVSEIIEMLEECNDIDLIELIYQILCKSK